MPSFIQSNPFHLLGELLSILLGDSRSKCEESMSVGDECIELDVGQSMKDSNIFRNRVLPDEEGQVFGRSLGQIRWHLDVNMWGMRGSE